MNYIALKPCSFGGSPFLIGQEIPEHLVKAERVKYLTDCGIIASYGQTKSTEIGSISVPILSEDGFADRSVSVEALSESLKIIQTPSNEAIDQIAGMEDSEVLSLISAFDTRKGVKSAAGNQMESLPKGEE